MALRVLPAITPPCFAMVLFSSRFLGFLSLLISVVLASASMLSTSSRLVILSRRFSFFKPFSFLYSFTVLSLQPLVMISVSMANSWPFFTPRFSHSSVSSFRTSILLTFDLSTLYCTPVLNNFPWHGLYFFRGLVFLQYVRILFWRAIA